MAPRTVEDTVLNWEGIIYDSGTLATRPINQFGYRSPVQHEMYPQGLPTAYSWYYGGESYMGEAARVPGDQWAAMTGFHVVYPRAVSAGGAGMPSVACNIFIRDYIYWAHLKTGGWVLVQQVPPSIVQTGRFDGPQTGNQAYGLNPVNMGGGEFREPSPPLDFCNHGWPSARGSYAAGSIDGMFGYFRMRIDNAAGNYLASSGIDLWVSTDAPFPQNTGYNLSAWKIVTTNFQYFTSTSMSEAALRADPPPPLVNGIPDTPGGAASGVSFIITPNRGSMGGNIIVASGNPRKSLTQLNSKDVLTFANLSTLAIDGRNWTAGANVSLFAVINPVRDSAAHGIATMGFYSLTTGWVFYANHGQSPVIGGTTVPPQGGLDFGAGGSDANGVMQPGQPFSISTEGAPAGWNMIFRKIGLQNVARNNGTALTLLRSVTGANTGLTNRRLTIGAGNADTTFQSEHFQGECAYLVIMEDPTVGDIEKLEGWAAWRFNLVGLLPAGHPYKAIAPRVN